MSELEKAVKEFFELLDTVEVSDSGTPFFPHQISSVRAMSIKKWEEIMERMRKEANVRPRPKLEGFK